eukprot:2319964-Pleurochrysis_carterae.AAC.2
MQSQSLPSDFERTLLSIAQTSFKRELVSDVRAFVQDTKAFREDFEQHGPGVPDLAPAEAVERLRAYQRLHEAREAKLRHFSAGEELFGLPVTKFPDLRRIGRELELLDRLYTLYTTVTTTVAEYHAMRWSDVAARVDEMSKTLGDLKAQCFKIPKELRHWSAYGELKAAIESLLWSLPLVQALSHPAMRERHWAELASLTGQSLEIDSDKFKLSDLLEVRLLEFGPDVESITVAARKELQLEEQLAVIGKQWADEQLAFAQFKGRSALILDGDVLIELGEKLEESLQARRALL